MKPGVERIMEAREHKLECGKLEIVRDNIHFINPIGIPNPEIRAIRCVGCGKEWTWDRAEWPDVQKTVFAMHDARFDGALLIWKETEEA